MTPLSFQEQYPPDFAHCYGCGHLNPQGHHLKSYWDGDETIAEFTPKPHHTAIPGIVYGGLIASLIDCHGTGSAAGAMARHLGREIGDEPPIRFVTASLKVDYLKPTPLGPPLQLRGTIAEIKGRKVVVHITLSANGEVCAKGEVVAVMVQSPR